MNLPALLESEVRNADRDQHQERRMNDIPTYVDQFDQFWSIYPKHHGKADALKRWSMMTPKERRLALEAAEVFAEVWRRGDPERFQFIPFPRTWLDQRRWEDNPVMWRNSAGLETK